MAFELKMPQLGLTMEEGTLSKWIKHEGDTVKAGDVVAEITTDKLTNELTSEQDGVLLKIVAQEGDDVPVKGTLAWIGQPGEAVPGAVPAAVAAAVPQAPAAPAAAAPAAGGKKSVIVIVGGPGGYVAAIRAAQLGADVTVIEKQYLGGTCLNVGCIPTKCLLHSAELVEQIKTQGKDIGVEVEGVKVNFPQVIAHKNAISKQLTSGVAGLLKLNKVKKVDGTAKFTGEKQLEVTKPDGSKESMTADAIIVATGSVNAQPPIPGLKENPNCIDSTGALSLEKLPATMVVIGGGVIGLELACAYAAFGTKITVVEAMDHMLPMLDGDLTKIGVAHMKKMGMEFHLECPVQSVEDSPATPSASRRRRCWWPSAARPIPPRWIWPPARSTMTRDVFSSTTRWRPTSPAYTPSATACSVTHSWRTPPPPWARWHRRTSAATRRTTARKLTPPACIWSRRRPPLV